MCVILCMDVINVVKWMNVMDCIFLLINSLCKGNLE